MRYTNAPATRAALGALLGAWLIGAAPSQAATQEPRTVEGRVVRPFAAPATASPSASARPKGGDSLGLAPVPNVMVTLHRVGKDGNGPLDSMRTSATGTYRFSYRTKGSADAVYFTSVMWGGIAYFTAPLRTALVRDRDAEITVFDTTSRTFPLTISGRHLIIGAADTTDERAVVEVFELSNDSTLTLIAGDTKTGTPTWSVRIPTDARDIKVGQGEISPDAFAATPGHISLFSPMAPGVKQVSFSYHLPTRSFPLPFLVEHGAVVLEVLLEEAAGKVSGGGLVAADPVAIENRNFRRFLAQDVKDGTTITLDLPSGPSIGRSLYIASLLGTIGIVMLLILLRAMQRRRPVAYATPVPVAVRGAVEVPTADRLAREIADLDATFARHENASPSLRAAYEERRAELKDALAAAIARG